MVIGSPHWSALCCTHDQGICYVCCQSEMHLKIHYPQGSLQGNCTLALHPASVSCPDAGSHRKWLPCEVPLPAVFSQLPFQVPLPTRLVVSRSLACPPNLYNFRARAPVAAYHQIPPDREALVQPDRHAAQLLPPRTCVLSKGVDGASPALRSSYRKVVVSSHPARLLVSRLVQV